MRFALIGAAGYIAPRHMAAIKAIGGDLVAAYDPSDSVGVLDRYFPACEFFTEFERFDRHIDKLRRYGKPVQYVSICSPNYLHDAHARWAMRAGADVICEKPLVINSRNIDGLALIEKETGRRVNAILQLRLHPDMAYAKRRCKGIAKSKVSIKYITPRGKWYARSWKGDESKSGGVATNIGIHLFDAITDIFGRMVRCTSFEQCGAMVRGEIELERANVDFLLSTDAKDVPKEWEPPYRCFEVNGELIDVSHGFDDLHVFSYAEIINGRGFGIEECRPAIELVEQLRQFKQDDNNETRFQLHDLAPGEKRAA